jgi:hypothetical protein
VVSRQTSACPGGSGRAQGERAFLRHACLTAKISTSSPRRRYETM